MGKHVHYFYRRVLSMIMYLSICCPRLTVTTNLRHSLCTCSHIYYAGPKPIRVLVIDEIMELLDTEYHRPYIKVLIIFAGKI